MNLLHLILVVLLGLLGSSMAAMPDHPIGGHIANTDTDHNANRGSTKELAGHESSRRALSGMLLGYTIRCDTDPGTEPPLGFRQGKLLSAKYCADWLDCRGDGTLYQAKEPRPDWDPAMLEQGRNNIKWCKDHCECVLADQPKQHYNWNMGCPSNSGGYVYGNYGSVSRDTDSAGPPTDDGLVMEACDGPPRNE